MQKPGYPQKNIGNRALTDRLRQKGVRASNIVLTPRLIWASDLLHLGLVALRVAELNRQGVFFPGAGVQGRFSEIAAEGSKAFTYYPIYAYADAEHKRQAIARALGDSAAPDVDSANYTMTDEELLKRLCGL